MRREELYLADIVEAAEAIGDFLRRLSQYRCTRLFCRRMVHRLGDGHQGCPGTARECGQHPSLRISRATLAAAPYLHNSKSQEFS